MMVRREAHSLGGQSGLPKWNSTNPAAAERTEKPRSGGTQRHLLDGRTGAVAGVAGGAGELGGGSSEADDTRENPLPKKALQPRYSGCATNP